MAQLTEVCANIKNYFLRDKYHGTYTISPGTAPLPSLLNGQYFRIVGSTLNDGVWQNTSEDLANLREEEFSGEIWSMGVPRDFEQLCDDINAWRAKNESLDSANMSPFSSESFGGYSYSKGSSGSLSGGAGVTTWQSMFRARLNTYRRIAL
ncbi:MAG: hypothetical protein J6Y64_09220 [Ruminococcus sp.]|nr:hypothetical protein [Ruminococcus sp.]